VTPTQSWRSQLRPDNPEILSCYLKSTSESSLINHYGTRRSRNGLVLCRATTYKRGMTVPESTTTPTASNHHTGSAGRKYLGVHLPAKNRSSRLVDECTLEEITRRVNKQNNDMHTQISDSNYTWRRSGKHTRKNAGEQLEMKSAPSTGRMSSVRTGAPTWRMISATTRTPER